MKKTILFITVDLRYGGTNSSLSNVYSILKDTYDIRVFSLYNKKIGDYSFKDQVLPSGRLIYWCYSYFSDLSGWDKAGAFLFKFLIRFCSIIKFDLTSFLRKREASKIQKNYHFDLVIGFQEGAATEFATLFNGIKKMAWIHCDYARYHSMIMRDEQPIYEKFDRVICVSNYTAKMFAKVYPSLKDKVVYIYNLYDKDRAIKMSHDFICEDSFDTSLFTILSVGRIDHVKRFSYIPAIAKKVKESVKDFKWYVIGNVVEKKEYISLCENIKKNGVESNVVLLGGKSNPYPYFAKSNLFVTTSSSEACPIVFLEAQTFNIPIITTAFGSASEFIIDGENGYITTLDMIHTRIIDVMNGILKYRPIELINNSSITNQIISEFNYLMSCN